MKQLIAALFLTFLCNIQAEAAGGLLLYTANGSPYVNAVQYETYSAPSAHLSNVTVKGGGQTQIQSSGIIANIPFPVASTPGASEDAEAMIAQTEMLAAKYPQYAQLLQSVGTLWKRSLEASKAQAAADAKKRAEEDRIAAEKQKQEEDRLAKEAETQRLAQVEQEQKAKKEEEQRLARLEEIKKVALAEQQRLAEVEQDRIRKEDEKQRLAQIEAEKQQKEDEIKRIAEEQRQAAQEVERQNAELAAITQKILQQDSSERKTALFKLGIGMLILSAGIWVFVIAVLKCFDICSKVRKRWRPTLPPDERVIEMAHSQESPRRRKMLVTGIALLLAGVACLVLPFAWLPTIFWIISPLLFAAVIILFHMLLLRKRQGTASALMRILRISWFIFLYALLGISTGAANLVVIAFASRESYFMDSGWNIIDISEPAINVAPAAKAVYSVRSLGSPISYSEKISLRSAAEKYAEGDVRTGVKVGVIPLIAPSNESLNSDALQRWYVYRGNEMTKSSLLDLCNDPDAKLYWLEAYKSEYIRNLKPLIESNRRAKSPAF